MVLARRPPERQPLRIGDRQAFKAAVRAHQKTRRGRKLRRAPKVYVPRLIEAVYFERLKKAFRELISQIERRILPEIPSILASAPHLRADELELRFDEFDSAIQRTINGVRIQFLTRVRPEISAAAREVAIAVNQSQSRDQAKTIEAVVGVRPELQEPWLESFMTNFVSENVRLVDGFASATLDRVAQRIGNGVRQGLRASDIADQIKGDIELQGGSITENRAKLIAQDQVGTLYGTLARVRQEKIGIKRYTWRTSRDERVRESHVERDGVVFEWSAIEPQLEEKGLTVDKIDGHPGVPIRCRCVPEPLLDDLFADDQPAGDGDTPPEDVPANEPPPDQAATPAPEPADETTSELRIANDVTATGNVAEKAKDLFGRAMHEHDLAALTGFEDATVDISRFGRRLFLGARQQLGGGAVADASREIARDSQDRLFIRNVIFEISGSAQGQGLGAKIFERQVDAASRLGVEYISADCHRGPGFNGYYTWARFGYDGDLPEDLATETNLKRISELMATSAGRELWKARGESFEGVFDTRPGSASMKTLHAYLAERKKR